VLARAVDEAQTLLSVEGKDGDVNLRHDFAQQRRGLLGAQPLFAHRLAERIGFHEDLAHRVIVARPTRAQGVILLAQGAEQIGKGLQGHHHAPRLHHLVGVSRPQRDQPRNGPQ
jgi:hypothetical protein